MIRRLLFIIVPMLIPFVAYLIYWYGARRRRQLGRSDVPWSILFASSMALVVISLALFGISSGGDAGLQYTPATLQDGRVVPGRTE